MLVVSWDGVVSLAVVPRQGGRVVARSAWASSQTFGGEYCDFFAVDLDDALLLHLGETAQQRELLYGEAVGKSLAGGVEADV